MKVIQINAVYGSGSTGRICAELSEYMNKHNIENYVFYGSGRTEYKFAKRFNSDFDMKVHALLSRVTGKQSYFSRIATHKMIREMNRIKPDVVHLHNLHGNYINLKMLLKYLAKKDIATVVTLHDCWFMTGKCTHYTMEKCYKWQTGCHNCTKLKYDNKSWFFDRTPKMWKDKKYLFEKIPCLGVIGVSDWITNEGKKSILKNAKIIKRIYNWIDTDVFCPKDSVSDKHFIPENKFTIITASAGWNKNTDKFNDILKLSSLIDEDMQIIMIGGGLENEELPENIIKIGYVNDINELAKQYSCADVFVHVSREDTFGKVVAEAIACGIPAVVYNSTGLPELVQSGCGYVVECGDIDAVYEKIKLVRDNTKSAYKQNCVDFVRQKFEKNTLINETVELYKDLLKG